MEPATVAIAPVVNNQFNIEPANVAIESVPVANNQLTAPVVKRGRPRKAEKALLIENNNKFNPNNLALKRPSRACKNHFDHENFEMKI